MSRPANSHAPAFPVAGSPAWHGISVHDYFAGEALAAFALALPYGGTSPEHLAAIAANAYDIADAMCAERKARAVRRVEAAAKGAPADD
jgi:hypothetical protein